MGSFVPSPGYEYLIDYRGQTTGSVRPSCPKFQAPESHTQTSPASYRSISIYKWDSQGPTLKKPSAPDPTTGKAPGRSQSAVHTISPHSSRNPATHSLYCLAWVHTIQPKILPLIKRLKENREAEENKPTITARTQILDTLYDAYLDKLRPSDRYTAPRHRFLDWVPKVWPTIHRPFDVTVGPEDFAFVIDQLPELILKHHADVKAKVIKTIIPEASAGSSDPQASSSLGGIQDEEQWTLAKHVFRCEHAVNQGSGPGDVWMMSTGIQQILLGWTAVAGHQCAGMDESTPGQLTEKPHCRVTLHREASDVAVQLVLLAGLDPGKATQVDMDERDSIQRFAVAGESIPGWWTTEYPVMTWRGAVRVPTFDCFAHGGGSVMLNHEL
jgi:hypothetical protein